jgi:hypothetical protein
MNTITFTSSKRTVYLVAHYMSATTILPALAVAIAGKESLDDPVTVTLTVESILNIQQIMGIQQEGLVAKVNKELDELLTSVVMQAPGDYPELVTQLQRLKEIKQITREQIAQSGLTACMKVLELVGLNQPPAQV